MNDTMHARKTGELAALAAGAALVLGAPAPLLGHCDSMNGPVVQAAEEALRTGEVSEVTIWVGDDQEAELTEAFEKTLRVRKLGTEAKELADRYFYETAVRLHRQAEGMPYAGLKPAAPMPADIHAAEKALDEGSAKPVTDLLVSEIREKVGERFDQAVAAQKRKGESLEAGRRWVDAYVKYVVYVHGLHQAIQAGPAHGVGD